MKTAIYHQYGSPQNISIEEIEKPIPKKDEVLVNVKAASINPWDWDLLIGANINRLLTHSFNKPKIKILGCDIAGIVVEVGEDVKDFNVGDEIYGDISGGSWGGFAEFVCAKANVMALKPEEISFAEAASAPQAAVLALQALRYKGKPISNQKILLIGGGGGVGTFALQIAKLFGNKVTCVDKATKLELLTSLGADHVIDYESVDISKTTEKYDLIIDPIMKRSIFIYKNLLSENGRFSMVGGENSKILQSMFMGPIISLFTNKSMGILMHTPNRKDLDILSEYMSSKKILPIIDKIFPLEKTAEAFEYFEKGTYKGKIVITI